MSDQPASLLIGEAIIAALTAALGAALIVSWLMGRSEHGRGLREGAPNRGDVPSRSHVPASMAR